MVALMNVAQAFPGDMGIDLGSADAGVAEKFLNDPQIRTVLEQVGREAVPQHVRCHIARDAGVTNSILNAEPKSDWRERRATFGEENGARRLAGDELWSTSLEISIESCYRLTPERHHAFLIAFADHVQKTCLELQLFHAN